MIQMISTDLLPGVLKIVSDAENMLSSLTSMPIQIHLAIKGKEIADVELQMRMLVCSEFGVPWEAVVGKRRQNDIVMARHAYCYLARYYIKTTLVGIGKVIKTDHSTIIKACANVKNYLETNDELFVGKFNNVLNKLKNEDLQNQTETGVHGMPATTDMQAAGSILD